MKEIDIIKLYEDEKLASDKEWQEKLAKDLSLYVNGGFQGLKYIYYNYQKEQKIKFSDVIPFEDFINTNDVEHFYLDEVFFEVDNNQYPTNIACYIKSLCTYYINSDKSIENRKVDLISVVTRLEDEIHKSATSQFDDNPKLFDILKRIENQYRIIYSGLYKDFYPFLADRPINQNYGKESLHIFTEIKETIPLKLGVLFFTGQISLVDSERGIVFLYQKKLHNSGTGLAKVLANVINEKETSIKAYLNETKNKSTNDKNLYHSEKLAEDIRKFCIMNGFKITDSQWNKKQYEGGTIEN